MDALNACVPHYVRCIKPNEKKAANTFDTDRSREQVAYTLISLWGERYYVFFFLILFLVRLSGR